uniref:Cathepsin propeptide inhibitor domain-containing protein n=1 Tax=Aegilops tauschii subsp. strangulata TaxID=200361 RepID=A0A453SXQ2_AEGTS
MLFHQYKKGKKEEDMKEMFKDWVKKYNKRYRDEQEKATRFQMFRDTVDKLPHPTPERIHYLADRTDEEIRRFKAYPDGIQHEEYAKFCRDLLAKEIH